MKQFFIYTLFALCIVCFFGCKDTVKHHDRPRDVWVIRSVLDRQPRMLTLALDTACYVAYDVARCTLHKIWKGGIVLQGAAYSNQPNLQPISWGAPYTDTLMNNWKVSVNGKQEKFEMLNKGYRLVDGRVHLKFAMVLSTKDTIEIDESPEFTRNNNGKPGLERLIALKHVPKDVSVALSDGKKEHVLKNNSTTQLLSWYDEPKEQSIKSGQMSDHIGRNFMEKSDCFTCHEVETGTVGPSFIQVAKRYKDDKQAIEKLIDKVQQGSTGTWGNAVMIKHPDLSRREIKIMLDYVFSLNTENAGVEEDDEPEIQQVLTSNTSPGDGAPLAGVHPSFDLQTIRKDNFRPRVGGLAFMPDGRMLVTTWDSTGGVYLVDGVETGDTNKITVKRIAAGLAEPLGVEVVNGEIYVLQKHELTKLIDHDGDEQIDEYAAVCNSFGVTADFHEFAFGLVHKDGYFYATLSMAMRLLSHERQLPDRGTVIKIGMDGSKQTVIYGLRQPNGIALGLDDEIFITDNQGQWLPASKLIHVKQGEFHGMRWGLADSVKVPPPMALPAIWMPENDIANSPSQPVLIKEGVYKGQMLHGDVTSGGIRRDFLEKVNGEYQGCIFRFTQGLETGVNRLQRGPDGAIYIGGLGLVGGWSYNGKQFGLQKMKYNGKTTFEMLAVRARPDGFEIELTDEIDTTENIDASAITVQQWWYKPTASYGGPKMDVENLKVKKVTVDSNRKRLHLQIEGLEKEHVVYIRLPKWKSRNGQTLWTTETWYTLNNVPQISR